MVDSTFNDGIQKLTPTDKMIFHLTLYNFILKFLYQAETIVKYFIVLI